jgi:hypothetical protein
MAGMESTLGWILFTSRFGQRELAAIRSDRESIRA